jgi:hypothetical protein
MSDSRKFYVVIETQTDGTIRAWGPLLGRRADAAVDSLQRLDGVEDARAMPLLSSSRLSEEVPDWKRAVV